MAHAGSPKHQKRKHVAAVAVLILTFFSIFVFGGISLAKYITNAESAQGASVGAFVPAIAYGESWYDENGQLKTSLEAGSHASPNFYPFAVTNDAATTAVVVTVELTAEQVLPLEYTLYLADELLTPVAAVGDTRTYTCVLAGGQKADFSLSVSWLEGERDERFNGLTNDVRMSVVCEQEQMGGAR